MKKFVAVVSLMIIGLLVVSGCSGKKEATTQSTKKQETSAGLPVGSDYVYQSGERYVKITIDSPDEWSVQTEKMNFPEKMTVKDLKQDKDGYKLLRFTAKNKIEGYDAFFTSANEDDNDYYLVIDGDDFFFAPNSQSKDYNIQQHAENGNKRFVKQ
ncbi:hypothetical protein [Enterococcus faecalis]|uniref:Lipoprotein n=1 Tax=Enterococcus faecalis RP2S-4 TaxID=1244145 RepID=A0ABC9TPD5_ENTFL|nr:hypothetical protein [Enterococcus faecalis]EPI08721.1 hypothetical protein D358_01496 [Enterococcus faecalis RP2S-4]